MTESCGGPRSPTGRMACKRFGSSTLRAVVEGHLVLRPSATVQRWLSARRPAGQRVACASRREPACPARRAGPHCAHRGQRAPFRAARSVGAGRPDHAAGPQPVVRCVPPPKLLVVVPGGSGRLVALGVELDLEAPLADDKPRVDPPVPGGPPTGSSPAPRRRRHRRAGRAPDRAPTNPRRTVLGGPEGIGVEVRSGFLPKRWPRHRARPGAAQTMTSPPVWSRVCP
jgi:hypothetical protein